MSCVALKKASRVQNKTIVLISVCGEKPPSVAMTPNKPICDSNIQPRRRPNIGTT